MNNNNNNNFKNAALIALATTLLGAGLSFADTYRVSIENNPALDSVLKVGNSGTGQVEIQNNSSYTLYMPYQDKQVTIPALSSRTVNLDGQDTIELTNAWGQQVYSWSASNATTQTTEQTANLTSGEEYQAKQARWSETITRVRTASSDTGRAPA